MNQRLDFENSVGVMIKSASKSLEKALGERLKRKTGLTGGKWKILVALAAEDGISQKRLADMIFLETPTVVAMLDKLEEMRMIKRSPDPTDRRNNKVFLTEKSRPLIEPVVGCVFELRKEILEKIPKKDLETTKKVLQTIAKDAESYYTRVKSGSFEG